MNKFLNRKKQFYLDEIEKLKNRNSEIAEEIKKMKDDVDTGNVDDLNDKLDQLEREQSENTSNIEKYEFASKELENLENENNDEERGELNMQNLSVRGKLENLLKREDIKHFFTDVQESIQKRAFSEGKIAVPTEVVDLVSELVVEESVMLKHIEVLDLAGMGRIALPGTIGDAIWVEYGASLQELDLSLSKIELDAYKLGGFVVVPNDFIRDSLINLSMYVTKQLATSIAKALDKSVVNGNGQTGKQCTGIVTGTHADNKVTIATKDVSVPKIVEKAALIETKNTNKTIKVFVSRKTKLTRLLPLSIATSATGQIVAFTNTFPATDWEVVECDAVADNVLLIGIPQEYKLSRRGGIILENSNHAKFTDDATVFKGLGRFDGKLTHDKAFVVVTLGA